MNPLVRKFGRLILLPFNNEIEALGIWPLDMRHVKEIKNLSSYLKKLSCKYLLLITDKEKINMRRIVSTLPAENR